MFTLHNNLGAIKEQLDEVLSKINNQKNVTEINAPMGVFDLECFPLKDLHSLKRMEIKLQDSEFFKKCVSVLLILIILVKWF